MCLVFSGARFLLILQAMPDILKEDNKLWQPKKLNSGSALAEKGLHAKTVQLKKIRQVLWKTL